jgi:hypothetical protein
LTVSATTDAGFTAPLPPQRGVSPDPAPDAGQLKLPTTYAPTSLAKVIPESPVFRRTREAS